MFADCNDSKTAHSPRKRDPVNFCLTGQAQAHHVLGRFAQQSRAARAGGFLDDAHRGAGGDQLAQFVVEQQAFANGAAALEAGATAFGAALAVAMGAKHAYQTLRHDAVQRRNKGVGVHRHVFKAAQHVKHVVGVHGRKHQMPGQGGLHRNLRRFGVADFAHHDLVGVVPQNGT